MTDPVLALALIALLGIAAQWLAWRTQVPAIVFLLLVGFLIGPATGLVAPDDTFGIFLKPMISIAVAVILFEGGLTLNFAEIRETSPAVRRVIIIGAPLTWGLGFLAAHHLAGLSVETSAVISGIMVVTGPTVIMPLLRTARLPRRPASLLRWEAIIVDPIGAIFAVIAYEGAVSLAEGHGLMEVAMRLGGAVVIGTVIALATSRLIAAAFVRGLVPEFLKAPLILAAVIVAFGATNIVLEEAGLLTVTIMGVAFANSRLASLEELRRFKETITIILVSGLFIVLTASITLGDIMQIGARDFLFLGALLLVIRPLVILSTTFGSKLTWKERILCAWIAPRGIVAVAVSGLFAASLVEHGVEDAGRMVPLAFLIVMVTVVLHGFTIRPFSNWLGITRAEPPGLLIVGGSPWATALARKAAELKMPVLIADTNWNHLSPARRDGIPIYYGEILSEAAEHRLDMAQYGALIAATDNDAYNALVCTDLGPEVGRSQIFQLGRTRVQDGDGHAEVERAERHQLHFTVGGRTLFRDGMSYAQLQRKLSEGWVFSRTRLSEEFNYEDFLESRDTDTKVLFLLKANGRLAFSTTAERVKAGPDDIVVSFGPPVKDVVERAEENHSHKPVDTPHGK